MKNLFNKNWQYFGVAGILFTLTSCVEPNGGTDNQIVVIGNGSDWAKTLVVDVAKSDHLESLVMTSKGLSPVASRLQSEGAKVGNTCKGVQSNCGPTEVPPLFLEWIAPGAEKKVILKADQVNQNAQLKEQQVYEASSSGTSRRGDLEDVPFSSMIRPLFISEGSIIFVDQNDQLSWRNPARQTKWLASNITDLTSDGRQGIFYRIGEAWYVIGLSEMMSTGSLQAGRQLFKSGILYQADGDLIYALSLLPDATDAFHLRPQMLYQWSAQTKALTPVWKILPNENLIALDRSGRAAGQNSFYAFGKFGVAGGDLETKLMAWNSLGLQEIPTAQSMPRELVAGKDTLIAFERRNAEIVSAEVCRAKDASPKVLNGGSSFPVWSCEGLQALPEHLNQVVVTDGDEVLFLGHESLFKLVNNPEFKFVAINGTQRADLVGLRFLQIPSSSRIQ